MSNEKFLELVNKKVKLAKLRDNLSPDSQQYPKDRPNFYTLHLNKIDTIKKSGIIHDIQYGFDTFFKKMGVTSHDLTTRSIETETVRYMVELPNTEKGSNILINLWLNPNSIDENIKISFDITGATEIHSIDFNRELQMSYLEFDTDTIERIVLEGIDALIAFMVENAERK